MANKTLVSLVPVTVPPTLLSNANLLTNISRLQALNPVELLVLSILFKTIQLAVSTDVPSNITTYQLVSLSNATKTTAQIVTAAQKLIQDAKCVMGSIPVGDFERVDTALDYEAAVEAVTLKGATALVTDVDDLVNKMSQTGFNALKDLTVDELKRIKKYLALQLEE